ncbi:MAG: DNA polymerase III subunit delta [Firmicutes bacterium]|nr:DNA polymerase III subunit delta [Bacillota bacterium]
MTYLLYGTNDYLINQEIEKLKEKNNITDNDVTRYDYTETLIKDIIDDATLVPLFSNKKMIIVDNSTIFESTSKKEDTVVLEKYLSSTNDFTILIFIDKVDKLDERKKIYKLLKDNNSVIECNTLNINNLVKEKFESYKIDSSTITKFINRVGTNPYNLINEIEKLKIFKINEKVITDEDIKFASKNIEDNIFDLINYIVNKNSEKVIDIYHDLLSRGSEPIAILVLIANQFRIILQSKLLYYKGYTEKDIASTLSIHPYRVKLAIQNSRNYSNELLIEYIDKLATLDYEIKSGEKDADTGLELFLLGI